MGDLVLVEDGGPRYKWPLGMVQELIPGRDGKTRTVKVKIYNKMYFRPVQRLYKLELA